MAREAPAKRHEYIAVALFFLTALVLLSLASYDAHDSSFNVLSHKVGADNRVGRVGAYVSDILLQLLGLSAFMLTVPLFVVSLKLALGKAMSAPWVRTFGFLLLLCTTCTALQVFPPPFRSSGYPPGGLTGVFLADFLVTNLNKTGTIVVLVGGLLLALLASTTLSVQRLLERATESGSAGPGMLERFRQWRERRRAARPVVNIKPPQPPKVELTPRPAPVKPSPPAAPQEGRQPTVVSPVQAGPPQRPVVQDSPKQPRFRLPPVDVLEQAAGHVSVEEAELMERARQLTEKCAEFDVHGSVTQIHPGPVVTTFEFKPDAGVKYHRITGLVDDLCLGIKAESIRIDRIPGKATVGIEVPNPQRETIMLRDLIDSDVFRRSPSRLTLCLGKLINGTAYVTDLARMPHLLIAGATGAGKSVALNCMITSILYKATPEEVRFIFIDPKRLELGVYADIPHLLTPIVTDPKEASNALRWATNEMESRYKRLALKSVRNIDQYNTLVRSTTRQLSLLDAEEPEGELEKPLPYLVLVIDELADLMMVSSREVEESISRLAAMARAVGIHLILATQRPSVDVITGVIKANFPCRIAFKVATKVDSRTIIDSNGAEQLLGNGDMLFIPPGTSRLTRVHGAYISEKETKAIVDHLRMQGQPAFNEAVLSYGEEELDEAGNPLEAGTQDGLYNDAVRVVVSEGRASTSLLQRRLSIGYGRAAKLIDLMHQNNLVGPADGSKPREVLVGLDYLDRLN